MFAAASLTTTLLLNALLVGPDILGAGWTLHTSEAGASPTD
jgi:hypothetical protein